MCSRSGSVQTLQCIANGVQSSFLRDGRNCVDHADALSHGTRGSFIDHPTSLIAFSRRFCLCIVRRSAAFQMNETILIFLFIMGEDCLAGARRGRGDVVGHFCCLSGLPHAAARQTWPSGRLEWVDQIRTKATSGGRRPLKSAYACLQLASNRFLGMSFFPKGLVYCPRRS